MTILARELGDHLERDGSSLLSSIRDWWNPHLGTTPEMLTPYARIVRRVCHH